MDSHSLVNCLTDAERHLFDTEGLLVIPEALSPSEIDALLDASRTRHAAAIARGFDPTIRFDERNLPAKDPAFGALIDHSKTFPKVWGIMGWNISLYMTSLAVSPPRPPCNGIEAYTFHQDSGQLNRDIETHPRPRLSIKVVYYLTDVSSEGRGNTWVIRGSHLMDDLSPQERQPGELDGAEALLVDAGSAVILDRRTWHSSSTNSWTEPRVALFYGYSYRWMRPKGVPFTEALMAESDPIRRQLLGGVDDPNGTYEPHDGDPPLRVWLQSKDPKAVGPPATDFEWRPPSR